MKTNKKYFSTTPRKLINPDKLLEAAEALLKKQISLNKDISDNKKNILEEVILLKTKRYEEAVKMRDYMEKMSFKFITPDEKIVNKIREMNYEYEKMNKLYHEKLDKLDKDNTGSIWELFKLDKLIVNTTRKHHIENEKFLDENFRKKVSEGLVSPDDQALYTIERLKRLKERYEFLKVEDKFIEKQSESPMDYILGIMETDMPSSGDNEE